MLNRYLTAATLAAAISIPALAPNLAQAAPER